MKTYLLFLTSFAPVSAFAPQHFLPRSLFSTQLYMDKLVVISPPGGVGEVSAVNAAKKGSSVRWFVVTPPSSDASISLSSQTLQSIQDLGGKIELAGAKADTLLLPDDDSSSSIGAVSKWCEDAGGLICVLDGIDESIASTENQLGAKLLDVNEVAKTKDIMIDAIKVAAKEAGLKTKGMKVAVLSADDIDMDDDDEKEENSGLLGGLLGKKVQVPKSLRRALSSGSETNLAILRYGELFGIPESSPESSPFIGGPRKDPTLRDEYTMKGVRIDSTVSVSGNSMMGESTLSSRLSVGEAAVRMVSKEVDTIDNLDVCLTSVRGLDAPSDEEWSDDFSRIIEKIRSGRGSELFSATFGSVPSVERLADWIATKWAPAILKTYDIAGIRVGARPVYASRSGEGQVEIVWQELKDFKTNVVGKMIIDITNEGLTARRAAGDANAGFGSVSLKPLAGENILVRRLSDAVTQATEKGLATKPVPKKRPKKELADAPVVSTTIPSVNKSSTPAVIGSETGPRAGARRSSERIRGTKKVERSETKSFE